jgi:hypothetical protein
MKGCSYPCIKISNRVKKGMIVLFTKPAEGYVLVDDVLPFSYFSKMWAEDHFEIYNGTIELTNEGIIHRE